jgi:dienelactone hydrolase
MPRTCPADITAEGVSGVMFEAMPWRGKPTRTFAWIGVPEGASDRQAVPGMVLVHGGGGTAFDEWVRRWVARGYAAIAMDTCGCVAGGTHGRRPRHDHGGPPGSGGFDQLDEPIEDQWSYHAVADVILAHTVLADQPGVDAGRIGLNGISWGGYLACIVAAVDPRLAFANPIYGCGFYDLKHDGWGGPLDSDRAARQRWLDTWDPSLWLGDVTVPMLWLSSPHDFAYPIEALQRSADLTRGENTVCLVPGLDHGHEVVWPQEEAYAYADWRLRDAEPLLVITDEQAEGRQMFVECAGQRIAGADLVIADERGPWIRGGWRAEPATVSGDGAQAAAPDDCAAAYLNVRDSRGLITSGRMAAFA